MDSLGPSLDQLCARLRPPTAREPVVPPAAPSPWTVADLVLSAQQAEGRGDVIDARIGAPWAIGDGLECRCARCHRLDGDIEVLIDGVAHVAPCPDCQPGLDLRRHVAEALMPWKWSAQLLSDAVDWQRYRLHAGCERPVAEAQRWCARVAAGERPPALVLGGRTGAGKSHLAAIAMGHALRAGRIGRWIEWPWLLRNLRAQFGKKGSVPPNYFRDTLPTSGLLVIDDLGVGRATEWVHDTVWSLFELLPNQVALVITTNLQWTEFTAAIGDRGASRLRRRTAPETVLVVEGGA